MRSGAKRLTIGLGVLGLLATACGVEGDVAVREPVAAAAPGGTIHVGMGRPGAIDPGNAYEPNSQFVVRTLCDTILQQDPVTGELVGGLAESWLVTDLGNHFTVRLRDDLKFSNGDAVTADDVVRSLSRVASQEYASGVQDLLGLVDGFDEISGRVEAARDDDLDKLRGLRVIDSRSFEIRLKAQIRFPNFLRVLTHPATAPVNTRIVRDDPDAMAAAPVCVGPYRLAEPWDGGDEIRLQRGEAYTAVNGAYTSGGTGYVDEIVLRLYDTPAERERAFGLGEVDVVHVDPSSASIMRTRWPSDVVSGLSGAVEYVGLPASGTSVWNDPVVRTALSMAIDREWLVNRVYGGSAQPATTFYPPTLGPEFHVPDACGTAVPVERDVEAARALLREHGTDLRGQPPLTFSFNDDGRNALVARSVAALWEQAFGIRVELQPMAWNRYRDQATGNEGFEGAFRESWAAEYPDPEQYVNALFTDGGVGQANWARFSDPDMSLALGRYIRRNDVEEDIEVAYQGLETEFLCAQMPLIPIALGTHTYGIRTDALASANGRLLDRGSGRPLLRELYRTTPTDP